VSDDDNRKGPDRGLFVMLVMVLVAYWALVLAVVASGMFPV